VTGFPYMVFYVEREADVDVWRVLHAARDIPEWLRQPREE
ncbi:MAG: type II toxin-antitoxin system RelE/ParE family toxin, partial [Chloroflexi bacterium]|nr:type II toxin-antitoxin system RelE/ParE family toxin [Chloroflexota bacterium]